MLTLSREPERNSPFAGPIVAITLVGCACAVVGYYVLVMHDSDLYEPSNTRSSHSSDIIRTTLNHREKMLADLALWQSERTISSTHTLL